MLDTPHQSIYFYMCFIVLIYAYLLQHIIKTVYLFGYSISGYQGIISGLSIINYHCCILLNILVVIIVHVFADACRHHHRPRFRFQDRCDFWRFPACGTGGGPN